MGESDKKHIPVACTLDAGATAEQLDDWAALQALCAQTNVPSIRDLPSTSSIVFSASTSCSDLRRATSKLGSS